MMDANGDIMKMTLSTSAAAASAATTTTLESNTGAQETAALTPERQHVMQWLDLRGISLLGDGGEGQADTRRLTECKSVRGNGGARTGADAPPLLMDASCAKMLKLLLGSARAHHALQGEAAATRALVQSFIIQLLRTHVQRTDAAKLQVTRNMCRVICVTHYVCDVPGVTCDV